MRLLNYTPHRITLIGRNGKYYNIHSQGTARCDYEVKTLKTIYIENNRGFVEIPLEEHVLKGVSNLPESQEGVMYVVSRRVVEALKGVRNDLVSPSQLVSYSDGGKKSGCKSVCIWLTS